MPCVLCLKNHPETFPCGVFNQNTTPKRVQRVPISMEEAKQPPFFVQPNRNEPVHHFSPYPKHDVKPNNPPPWLANQFPFQQGPTTNVPSIFGGTTPSLGFLTGPFEEMNDNLTRGFTIQSCETTREKTIRNACQNIDRRIKIAEMHDPPTLHIDVPSSFELIHKEIIAAGYKVTVLGNDQIRISWEQLYKHID
jgi:hypothetical protein